MCFSNFITGVTCLSFAAWKTSCLTGNWNISLEQLMRSSRALLPVKPRPFYISTPSLVELKNCLKRHWLSELPLEKGRGLLPELIYSGQPRNRGGEKRLRRRRGLGAELGGSRRS